MNNVPIAALQMLVAQWRADAVQEAIDRLPGWVGAQSARDVCADELTELIAAHREDGKP